ncbi:hypothetical protein D3C77_527210 [compost metagenome]
MQLTNENRLQMLAPCFHAAFQIIDTAPPCFGKLLSNEFRGTFLGAYDENILANWHLLQRSIYPLQQIEIRDINQFNALSFNLPIRCIAAVADIENE